MGWYTSKSQDLLHDVTTKLNQRTMLQKLLAKYTTNKAFYFLTVCLVYKYRNLLQEQTNHLLNIL